MADRRGISKKRLAQEAIAEAAGASIEERLCRAYDLLAVDSTEVDIESFFPIQAEALENDADSQNSR